MRGSVRKRVGVYCRSQSRALARSTRSSRKMEGQRQMILWSICLKIELPMEKHYTANTGQESTLGLVRVPNPPF